MKISKYPWIKGRHAFFISGHKHQSTIIVNNELNLWPRSTCVLVYLLFSNEIQSIFLFLIKNILKQLKDIIKYFKKHVQRTWRWDSDLMLWNIWYQWSHSFHFTPEINVYLKGKMKPEVDDSTQFKKGSNWTTSVHERWPSELEAARIQYK